MDLPLCKDRVETVQKKSCLIIPVGRSLIFYSIEYGPACIVREGVILPLEFDYNYGVNLDGRCR